MVFTAKFYIGYSDINKDYNLTNTSLLKLFENVASMHSHVAKDDINVTALRTKVNQADEK